MQAHYRSHLLATESALREHLAEIRKVVTTGESPGGGRSQPLPERQRAQLLAILEGLETSLTALMRRLGLDRDSEGTNPRAGSARMWASLLLRTMAELLRDLRPEVMERRYGAADPAVAETLRETLPGLAAEIARGIDLLS